jgi:hypothetical protein
MLVHLFRALVGLIGLLMLYAGVFLTETEEGGLQNRLEELWIRVDDAQSKAMTRQAALLQQVSRFSVNGITKVFGQKLFSIASIASCLCFSMASLFFSLAYFVELSPLFPSWATLTAGIIYTVLAFSRRLRYLGGVLLILGGILSVVGIGMFRFYQISVREDIASLCAFALGIVAVIGSVALTRWSLAFASRTSNPAATVAVILANVILAACLVSPLLFVIFAPRLLSHWPKLTGIARWRHLGFVFSASATTLFAAALALFVVLVLLAALVHRILWPTISRIVYAAHRYGLVEPKWLRRFGFACLILAWPNSILVRGFVKALQSVGLRM